MRLTTRRFTTIAAVIGAVALGSGPAFAADASAARSAQDRINDAASLVQQMQQDPGLAAVLQRARGIFIIPHYGRGGLVVGGQGGGGVVLVKNNGQWSSPAFFNMGGASVGAQAGGEGGAIAMILMTRKAVNRFIDLSHDWSLNGSAGLTVVTWSGRAEGATSRDDVILWTNTQGLYGGLTASLTHIGPDTQLDRAYYRGPVSTSAILGGNINSPNAAQLRDALSSRMASR